MYTLPNDSNGDVLRRMQLAGDSLQEPRDIEFNFVFQNIQWAKQFSEIVQSLGYNRVSYKFWEEKMLWDSCVVVFMAPDHGQITEIESKLDGIARGLSGKADGWGCFTIKSNIGAKPSGPTPNS